MVSYNIATGKQKDVHECLVESGNTTVSHPELLTDTTPKQTDRHTLIN
jgi:hypothetical protein